MTKHAFAGIALAAMLAAAPGVAMAASYGGAPASRGGTAFTAPSQDLLVQAQHREFRGRPVLRGGGPGWGYRPWYRRPYYGTIIGGIAIGSIIAATAYGVAPPRPGPDMCWYWADEMRSRGYWDYC